MRTIVRFSARFILILSLYIEKAIKFLLLLAKLLQIEMFDFYGQETTAIQLKIKV